MPHICIGNLAIIGSDNGLSPHRRRAITWTNAWILLIRALGTDFSEISIKIHTFSFKKMHLKISSAKRGPFCLSLKVLNTYQCYPGYFWEPRWHSMGLVEIFRLPLNVLWVQCPKNHFIQHIYLVTAIEQTLPAGLVIKWLFQKLANFTMIYCFLLMDYLKTKLWA